jgi:hypothetical protein
MASNAKGRPLLSSRRIRSGQVLVMLAAQFKANSSMFAINPQKDGFIAFLRQKIRAA